MNALPLRVLLAVFIVMLVGLQYRLWFAEGGWFNNQQLERRVKKQNLSNRHLSEQNQLLAEDILALKQGYDEVEARARENYGMVKKDETFFLLLEKNIQQNEDK